MKDITKKNLEFLKVPEVDTTHHRVLLKKTLLSSSHWDKKTRFVDFFMKGGEEIIVMNKFFNLGIIAIVMIIAALFVVFSPMTHTNTQKAYAEQLAKDSSQAVSQLTQSQLQSLKQKLPTDTDPDELLQEAKNAKDLKTLTYDEFSAEYSQEAHLTTGGSLPLPPGAPSPEVMDMHNLKFLQFTDAKGDKVVLGIDQSNLPVFMFGTREDGHKFGAVRDNGKAPAGDGPQQVGISLNGKGKSPVIMVNGKKYVVPASVTIVPGSQPPSIQMKDGDVYVNGVKATQEQ